MFLCPLKRLIEDFRPQEGLPEVVQFHSNKFDSTFSETFTLFLLTNGCSFLQAFLSSPNLATAIPDILIDIAGLVFYVINIFVTSLTVLTINLELYFVLKFICNFFTQLVCYNRSALVGTMCNPQLKREKKQNKILMKQNKNCLYPLQAIELDFEATKFLISDVNKKKLRL